MADAEVVRMAVGAGRAFSASLAAAARGEGDFGRPAAEFALPADKKGEAVRETTGGVPDLDGGLLGRLMVGLSQEEKKSSAGSPAGVDALSAAVDKVSSVITTSFGYLLEVRMWLRIWFGLRTLRHLLLIYASTLLYICWLRWMCISLWHPCLRALQIHRSIGRIFVSSHLEIP
jgi:hypothetical protein